MTTDTKPLAPTDAEIATLIDKEMREYSIGAYADHGSARNQLEHFAREVRDRARPRLTKGGQHGADT